jgi:hypothetical protein
MFMISRWQKIIIHAFLCIHILAPNAAEAGNSVGTPPVNGL